MDIEKSVRVGNLVYRARVMSGGLHFDGHYLALLRYTYDPNTHLPLESHYWTPDGQWTKFPIGGEFRASPIPFLDWPKMAREIVMRVREPEAAKLLARVIVDAEKERMQSAD